MGDWRLFFLHRDRIRKVTRGRRAARGARRTSSRRTAPSACSSRRRSPIAPRCRRRPTSAALAQGLQGRRRRRRRRGVRSVARPTSKRAPHGLTLPGGLKLALLPKKTRGDTVVANVDAALRRREEPGESHHGGRLAGAMLMRGTHEAHAPADPGRVRSPEGARQRRRRPDQRQRADRDDARESAGGASRSSPRCCRSRVPRRGVRAAQAAAPGRARAAAKSEPQVLGSQLQRHLNPYPKGDVRYVPTLEERSLTSKPSRWTTRRSSTRTSTAPRTASSPSSATSMRRRLRSSRRAVRRRGRRHALHARARYLQGCPAHQPIARDAGQGQRVLRRRASTSTCATTIPTTRRWCSGNYMLGRRLPELAARDAHPAEGRPQLRRRHRSSRRAALDRAGIVHHLRDLRAAERRAKLEAAFKEELTRALADGFTDDEVKAAKAGWLQSSQVTRAQDAIARQQTQYCLLHQPHAVLGRGAGIDRRQPDAG